MHLGLVNAPAELQRQAKNGFLRPVDERLLAIPWKRVLRPDPAKTDAIRM